MKNNKRAYRRYKTWVKFNKRVNLQIAIRTSYVLGVNEKQDILYGKSPKYVKKLKTQGRPCNCSMCRPNPHWDKFKRELKQYWLKEAMKEFK